MVLYDPASGGYFVQTGGQMAMNYMDDDYDSEDDTPPGKLQAFVEKKMIPRSTVGRCMCLVFCFLCLTGIGFGVVLLVIKGQSVVVPPIDPDEPVSSNMTFFLNILGTKPNFTYFGEGDINNMFNTSYMDTDNMGGPITRDLRSSHGPVKVPSLSKLTVEKGQ